MTREEALALLALPQEEAVARLPALAEKAEHWDRLQAETAAANDDSAAPGDASPLTPSGMVAPFLKPAHRRRPKRPGRKRGHPGVRRPTPTHIDSFLSHTLTHCPDCAQPLGRPVRTHRRLIEEIDLPPAQVHQHEVAGYWCGHCRKIVSPTVTDALPHATLGLHLVTFSAWLHYRLGISVGNVVRILARTLSPYYEQIGRHIRSCAVLHADETSWRLNGITYWLWAFCTERLCYFLIDPHRSSAVVARLFGELFDGILVCDFYAAYNLVNAWAKQRCLFHLFAELRRVDQRNASTQWRDFRHRLSRLLHDAIALQTQRPSLPPALFERRKLRLHRRLDALIAQPFDDADTVRLRNRLRNFRGASSTIPPPHRPTTSPSSRYASPSSPASSASRIAPSTAPTPTPSSSPSSAPPSCRAIPPSPSSSPSPRHPSPIALYNSRSIPPSLSPLEP